MNQKLLAQVNFQEILDQVFPDSELGQGAIKINKADLTLGEIISSLLPYIFALAGLALLLYLTLAGFELLTSTGDPKKIESAKSKLTNAIIGFLIIFVSYWLIQILEAILGITIFGI